jgi:hypothetical protein
MVTSSSAALSGSDRRRRVRPLIAVFARTLDRPQTELDDGIGFFEWARSQWPEPRLSVELDPWQLSRGL